MEKLFGTDGIRGKAGIPPLDQKTVTAIAAALGGYYRTHLGREPKFVSGRDTRESGPDIEAYFHAGIIAAGGLCESAGVITTPGVAYLTNEFEFDAGIVISASHNPYQDNGIKLFAPDGKKVGQRTEEAIDKALSTGLSVDAPAITVNSDRSERFCRSYLEYLLRAAGSLSLEGKKLVIDCANGAASGLAPELFESLGARLTVINNIPDGKNINRNCGSLHLANLQAAVLDNSADAGIAFDGDADRALFVNESGEVVDGDATLWILANYLKSLGKLKNSTVVATVMSNIGLEKSLESKGMSLLRADVGDKYVLEKLLETNSEIGGEQSGHIIFPEIGLVGDGIITAILLLQAVVANGSTFSAAASGFSPFPQILVNVPVSKKLPFENVPKIASAAEVVETELGVDGRLLLRYSGTENLARIMIEGKEQAGIEVQARELARIIDESLG